VTDDGSCPNLNAMHGHDVHVVALDGDKLKPRMDRHGVAYGMDARNTGLYGEGATGEEVSMTQDANQCKGGKCVVLCADGGEVASTITRQISEQSGQDNRANAVVQIANGVSFDGRKDAPIAEGVAHSQTIGTNPGFKDGVVISTNSNGEDVAATINANMSKLGGDNQTTFGGGYCITRREEGAEGE